MDGDLVMDMFYPLPKQVTYFRFGVARFHNPLWKRELEPA